MGKHRHGVNARSISRIQGEEEQALIEIVGNQVGGLPRQFGT
jgi:hypothetical protein